jgi:diguanylate cyclase (GGDEF)-like protein
MTLRQPGSLIRDLARLIQTESGSSKRWSECSALFARYIRARNVTIVLTGDGHTLGPQFDSVLDSARTLTWSADRHEYAAAPIVHAGTVFGAVCIESSVPYSADDTVLLESAALFIGSQLHSESSRLAIAELERTAHRDALTGVPNRRSFDRAFSQQSKRARQDRIPLTIVVVDVDYFKGFNDTYGHQGGDECLQRVAVALNACMKGSEDTFARYGGEEFVCLLPGTDSACGIAMAEAFGLVVRELRIPHAGSTLGFVSISAGVASGIPSSAESARSLLEAADAELYRAKEAGRNRASAAGYRPQAESVHRLSVAAPTNLPDPVPLIGRDREVAELTELVQEARLVTVTAFGGTGKTSLALHVANGLLGRFEHGVWFADLGKVNDPAHVVAVVAELFGCDSSLAALTSLLRGRRAAIVLDTCEHVIDAVAELCRAILNDCPGVRLLATSRESLRLDGEALFRLGPLAVPDAVALFVERAKNARRDFVLTDANAPLLVDICHHLEGIALAIELVAARLDAFDLADLGARLHLLRSPTAADGEDVPGQATMRATIDWSYALLSEDEARVFRSLAVFSGGWTAAALRSVCPIRGAGVSDELDVMEALLDKSLVAVEFKGASSRYRMLDVLSSFAAVKLAEFGEGDDARRRHAQFYLRLAEAAERTYWTAAPAPNKPGIREEWGNFETALRWSLYDGRDVGLGAELAAYISRSWFSSSARLYWAEMALERLPSGSGPALEARLHLSIAQLEILAPERTRASSEYALAFYRGTTERALAVEALYHLASTIALYFPNERALARRYATECLDMARGLGIPRLTLLALRASSQAMPPADFAGRRRLLAESLDICRLHGQSVFLVVLLMSLSELEFAAGEYDAALRAGREALRAAETTNIAHHILLTKTNVAQYECMIGAWEAGRDEALQAVRLAFDERNEYGLTIALHALGSALAELGDYERAARLLGFSDARFGALHAPRQEGSCEETLFELTVAKLYAALGEAAATRSMDAGASAEERALVVAALTKEH